MESFATVEELQGRLDFQMSEGEQGVAGAALEDLTFDANAEAEKDWTAATVPPAVKSIVLRAAARYMRNFEGLIQSRAGDETLVWSDRGEMAGVAHFTEDEKLQLRKIGKVRKATFGSIRHYSWGYKQPRDGFVPNGGKAFPFFAAEDDGW